MLRAARLGLCVVFLSALTLRASAQAPTAAEAFHVGDFARARTAFAEAFDREPSNAAAATALGTLALYDNKCSEAQHWLRTALRLEPSNRRAMLLLAESYRRQDNYAAAADQFRTAGSTAEAELFQSFDKRPYQIEMQGQAVRIPFAVSDPLPVLRMRVNGQSDALFLLDTGAPDVILDPRFAQELRLRPLGSELVTLAGGKQFSAGAKLGSIAVSGLSVRNLPVRLGPTRNLPFFPGKRIDGIIGTNFLYHFRPTIDYPDAALILRAKETAGGLSGKPSAAKYGNVAPFWLAGDHFILTRASLNHIPKLFLIDSGLTGGAFSATRGTVEQAHIALDESAAKEGIGAGGRVRVIPVVAQRLSIGDAEQQNVGGGYVAGDPMFDIFPFEVGGLISHEYLKHYAVTLDFDAMTLTLAEP